MATAAALGTLIALAVLAGPVAPAKAAGDGDIRLVDFHGFTYPVPTGEIAERVRLRNGRRAGNAAGRCDVRLQSVSYGRLADVDGEVAAVTLAFNCGGTGNPSGGYLFRMERGRPRVVGEIAWGDRANGGVFAVAFHAGELVVERRDGDAACCTDRVLTERYSLGPDGLKAIGTPERRPWVGRP